MEHILNHIELCGDPVSVPEYSHENHGVRFFRFFLEVERLSGAADRLPVLCPELLLETVLPAQGERLAVSGQLRSYNRRGGIGRRLVISVLAQTLASCDGLPENNVQLTGALCRAPSFRRTPLGREISDVMLAVNRPWHRTDYLPCIFWGRSAQAVSMLPVGASLSLVGRLQSRDYVKQLPEGPETRTAYEISVSEVDLLYP